LCWLDARGRGAALDLRLEDTDPERCTPEKTRDMRAALAWLGLDWDREIVQSERDDPHRQALEQLIAAGWLYPCTCSRSDIRRAGLPAVDGGFRYPGTCRERRVSLEELYATGVTWRLRLPAGRIEISDEGDCDLSQDPLAAMGDPVVRRRDGAVAYQLACVVDDADAGTSRIVRGRDLAPSTALQVVLQRALGVATPVYRHHFLLLEEAGAKFAKLHGAVGWTELRHTGDARTWCGRLAALAGLRDRPDPASPEELSTDFSWDRVRIADLPVRWTGQDLVKLTDRARQR
jgi:glutamyl-tRNA synthetase/glutamyl-Q tRNA(Asp) synthetase